MYSDPIADFLTRIRNAVKAGHKIVDIPSSNLKVEMARILKDQGFILNYKVEENAVQNNLKIALKYDKVTRRPALTELKRVSRPGLRQYAGVSTVPRVRQGLGIAIVSTSQGVMTDKEARQKGIGGEVLCIAF
ncbi:MAG: 30S ribosomal protein S8 [Schleiferiaceae bacterium]|nr:30S ribosomal protein S8 [Schleiferiaceae bacterium]